MMTGTGRSPLADDCSCDASAAGSGFIAGAAEAKFLTAGNVEFTADRRVQAVVWLVLVPTARQQWR
jgi:hypothetical protein